MSRARAVCGVLAVLAVLASACGRTVTHDKGSYDRVLESGGASYTYPDAGNAYEGNSKAKAVHPGNDPSAHAFGELDARVADNDGTYGAAFYFPPGTLTGPLRARRGPSTSCNGGMAPTSAASGSVRTTGPG